MRAGSLIAALLVALPAGAQEIPAAGPETTTTVFNDGLRRVEAERLYDGRPPAAGGPVPVRLYYPDLGVTTRAEAGREVIVRLSPGADVTAVLAQAGLAAEVPLMPAAGLWLAEDTGAGDALDVAARFANATPPGIAYVTPDLARAVRPAGTRETAPDDPLFAGQWYLDRIDIADAWALEDGEPTTSVAVVDTGCDLAHPDLAPKLDPGLDVADADDDPSYVPGESGAAHGTHVAGLVAAATDNALGIAGTCPGCRMRCVRLIADRALPDSATVAAFQFALDSGAAVVSNSWGYVDPTPVPASVADAIETVFDEGRGGLGALVLFAAGNDGREIDAGELLSVRGVIGVGAINVYDEATSFTNRGAAVDLVAPAGTVTTDLQGAAGDSGGDYTDLFGGTSSACPVAAGVAALLVSAAPDRTAADLSKVLVETTRPAPYAVPDDTGHDPIYGYGIVDPHAALATVFGLPTETDGGMPDAGAGTDAGLDEGAGAAGGGGGCGCTSGGEFPMGVLLLVLGVLFLPRRP